MRHLFGLGALVLLSGCSGNYTMGKGHLEQVDGGGATGGGPNGTGGGNSAGGVVGKGGVVGAGGGVVGGGGVTGNECTDPGGCAAPAVCQVCPNGGYSCAKADCINGKCQTVFDPCGGVGGAGGGGGVECKLNTDCLVATAPCQMCPDGTTACTKVECIGGKCVGSFPGCGGMACDPALCPSPPPNTKPCCLSTGGPCGVDNLDGKCVPWPTPGGCQSDFDCPVLASCKICPDGTCAPVSATCTNGQCITNYGTCGGGTGTLSWYNTCGDPICRAPDGTGGASSGYPACDPALGQKVTGPCDKEGQICDPGAGCGVMLQCAPSDPTHGGACPISRAKFKTDIEYVSADERSKLAADLQTIPLVHYRYKDAPDRSHLGFIIEDIEPSPSVDSKRDRVDLYGYTSMAVAAIQEQKKAIDALKHEVEALRAELARRDAK